MAKKGGGVGYFGLPWIVSLILAIIPVTSWIFGCIIALQNKSWIWFILRLLLGWGIFWIVDLISMIVNKKVKWLV